MSYFFVNLLVKRFQTPLTLHQVPETFVNWRICGVFKSMVILCILFSMVLNINYTAIFCNFDCINIFITGSRCFSKMSCKNDFTDNAIWHIDFQVIKV